MLQYCLVRLHLYCSVFPTSAADGNVLKCLQVFMNMPSKEVYTHRRSLDRHGDWALVQKLHLISTWNEQKWLKTNKILLDVSRCMNTGNERDLCFIACLNVRTASWMKEGDFSVIWNTLILKVVIKTEAFTGIEQINGRQKSAGKLAKKSSIGFDCFVCVNESWIHLLCKSFISKFSPSGWNKYLLKI